MSSALHVWTIYFDPRDFPGLYVARRFTISPDAPEPVPDAAPWSVATSLEAARVRLPTGLVRIERSLEDEPHIVECWV